MVGNQEPGSRQPPGRPERPELMPGIGKDLQPREPAAADAWHPEKIKIPLFLYLGLEGFLCLLFTGGIIFYHLF